MTPGILETTQAPDGKGRLYLVHRDAEGTEVRRGFIADFLSPQAANDHRRMMCRTFDELVALIPTTALERALTERSE